MHQFARKFSAALALFVVASCSSKPEKAGQTSAEQLAEQTPATLADVSIIDDTEPSFLQVLLSDAKEVDAASGQVKLADAKPLSATVTANVLSRMADLKTEPGDKVAFAKREKSLPPPKTSDTVKAVFPPPGDRERPDIAANKADEPLKILRSQPEGDLSVVPHVSVTFDQPMVDVTSHADTVADGVPVKIAPEPPGQWRWVGTKTVMFEPDGRRFPMATEYTVSVPKETASKAGNSLEAGKTWKFRTPTLAYDNYWPSSGTHGLKQPIFIGFNQKVDPQVVIDFIHLTINGGPDYIGVKLLDPEQVDDERIQQLVANAQDGRYVVVQGRKDLPYDSTITVTLKEGAPSAEGPRKLESDRYFNFRTYGPFRVTEHRCGWRGCGPNDSFSFRFSNQLDQEDFEATRVTVEPSFPTMSVNQYGNSINITGRKPGRRTYTVTLARDITDEFGQKLVDQNTYEFEVGPADPALYSTGGNFTVLDPSSKPQYTVFSTNYERLRVKAWKVEPKDWGAYLEYERDWRSWGKREKRPPGKLVRDEVIEPEDKPDDLVETTIDLSGITDANGHGNLVLVVTPDAGQDLTERERRRIPRITTWVQSTDIALDAFVDSGEFVAWATSLADGKPLADVNVTLKNSGMSGVTDKNGMARFPMTRVRTGENDALIGSAQGDKAFLPEGQYPRSTSWHTTARGERIGWFVFDDRQMYKPAETVTLKGWVRAISDEEGGQVALSPGTERIQWTAYGPMNNQLGKGEVDTTSLGGFNMSLDLPDTPNLGRARIEFVAKGGPSSGRTHSHYFDIQEFRTPEFEVTATAVEGPHYAGDSATASVEAKYYAGGGLPNAAVNWTVTTSTSSFRPPNLEEYTFGSWTPWWISRSISSGQSNTSRFEARTDATGVHDLALEFGQTAPPRPMTVRAQASVTDVNRQQWAATTNLLVHPSEHYIGMKSDTYFVEKGTPLEFDLVVSDVDGNVLEGRPVKVRATRVNWVWRNGEYQEEEKDPQTCEFMTKAEAHTCSFETKVGGQYKILATTVDDERRPNFTKLTRWVSGGDYPKARRVEKEPVQLIPDADEYKPGSTARILVQSPIVPAEAFLTLRRNGMVEQRRFTMTESTKTVEIPVRGSHMPNVFVQVDVVGAQPRLGPDGEPDETVPKRPAYGSGSIKLKVPTSERVLQVDLTPKEDRVSPGVKTAVDVVVKRADGKPAAGAEVAVVVVDEAILALSSYQMGDPMNVFYPERGEGVSDYHLRSAVSLVDVSSLQQTEGVPEPELKRSEKGGGGMRERSMKKSMAAPAAPAEEMAAADSFGDSGLGMDSSQSIVAIGNLAADGDSRDDSAGKGPAIAVRSNFTPLAAFAPAVKTDDAGKATVEIEMPDNLTRYRIMAVAVEKGTHYGTGESAITARLPLMVRPSPPRFLNFGDKFELPVVLQNQTDDEMTVNVASRATNIQFADTRGWSVKVPANDRVEVRFPASTEEAGTARFQVAAAAGKSADAAEFDLPVWTPATSEAFATYGVVDDGAIAQTVKTPGEVWPQFGQLEVTTSSTAVAELTDAFLYLYEYDYECAEQISSRVVTVAALRDVLTAFKAQGMPTATEVKRSMDRDIEELASRQNYDGGFGLWRRGQTSWPFVSIHAAHALARAKAKGYDVDANVMTRAKNYLTRIENYIPGWYSQWLRHHVIAYALYVRDVMGDTDAARARGLMGEVKKLDDLSFESVGWLLNVMSGDSASKAQVAEIRQFLNNRVTETAGAAHFAAKTTDEDYVIMRSNRVADGIILEALIEDQPKTDLIPKIVRGLLAHRKKGRWSNTQENAFVLLALDRYFNNYENITPNFVARAWLGDRYAGEHAFRGRTTENHQIDIPMRWLVDNTKGSQSLLLQKDGKGRMYYRIGMQYAPKDLYMDPADHGFVVERTYTGVDDPEDVKQLADGTWEVKAGAKVKIDLTMVAPTRRYHVALVDPLPAGFESMNPALAVTGDVPIEASNTGRSNASGWWWFSRPWYEHQNLRDERTEAFSTIVWGGVHTYTYYARATTPGQFVVPPAKAEEMYHPETFGRSGSTRVTVK